VRLGQDAHRAALDVREQVVEQAHRALAMTPGPHQLVEGGHYPEHLGAVADALEHGLDAALHRADVHLVRHDVGGARLEDGPAVRGQFAGQHLQRRALADTGLAHHEHRATVPRLQPPLHGVDVGPQGAVLEDLVLPGGVLAAEPTPEGLEERHVHRGRGVVAVLEQQLLGGLPLQLAQHLRQVAGARRSIAQDLGQGRGLAALQLQVEERLQELDRDRACPGLIQACEDLAHERHAPACGQRPQHEEAGPQPHGVEVVQQGRLDVLRGVVAERERLGRHAREHDVGSDEVADEVGGDVVGAGEERDALLEGLVAEQVARIRALLVAV